METLTEDKTDYALHIAHVLGELYTFSLRSYIDENSVALAYLYAAMPQPNPEALTGTINDVTRDLLSYSRPLAHHWTELVRLNAHVAVADAMQICGESNRRTIAKKRETYVTAAHTFWLAYWNTHRP